MVDISSDITEIIQELENRRGEILAYDEMSSEEQRAFFNGRVGGYSTVMYVPQTENYIDMLSKIGEDDVVCDMGAGDLRFALFASQNCRKVYAVEMNPEIVSEALKIIGYRIPRNLIPVCADWRFFPIPEDVTVVTCMVNIYPDYLPLHKWVKNGRRVFHGTVTREGDNIVEFLRNEEKKAEIKQVGVQHG